MEIYILFWERYTNVVGVTLLRETKPFSFYQQLNLDIYSCLNNPTEKYKILFI